MANLHIFQSKPQIISKKSCFKA